MEVLLEYYGGNLLTLSPEDKYELAQAIKAYHPKWENLVSVRNHFRENNGVKKGQTIKLQRNSHAENLDSK